MPGEIRPPQTHASSTGPQGSANAITAPPPAVAAGVVRAQSETALPAARALWNKWPSVSLADIIAAGQTDAAFAALVRLADRPA